MQHTTFENQTFRANPQETQKLSVQRTQQIIGIVLAVFLIAGYFLFDHWQEEKQYNHSESSLYGVLKISCLLGGLLEAITSPILLYELSKNEQKLSATYIVLKADAVEGLHFNDISVGKPFEVPYTEIITVMVLPDSPRIYHGNNLCIRTKESTYLCYAIDRAEAAVQSINERRQYFEEQVNHVPAVMPEAETDEPVNGYCAFCGTALPAEAVFCPKCGKNAHSTIQRNDRS